MKYLLIVAMLLLSGCVKDDKPKVSCPKCEVVFEEGQMSYICEECTVESNGN